jgi:repressor LexA
MARPRSSVLTPAHTRILRAISRKLASGFPPSVKELADSLGLAGVTSLMPTLRIMERNGFVNTSGGGERGKRRVVGLTPRGKATLSIGGLPVLGVVPAGPMREALSQCDTVLDESELLPHRPGDFLLIVDGDSMIGDGILPGDKVLLRPDVEVKDREIAAVQIGDDYEATLKHVHFGPGATKVTLTASNAKYRPTIVASAEVRVAGVYRGLVRNATTRQ